MMEIQMIEMDSGWLLTDTSTRFPSLSHSHAIKGEGS